MSRALTDSPVSPAVPSFGQIETTSAGWQHWAFVGSFTALIHVLLFVTALAALRATPPTFLNVEIARRGPSRVTPLVAPPSVLTQREPNKGELSTEFDLASLPPRPAQPSVPSTPGAAARPQQKFALPERRNAPVRSSALPEAPALDLRANAAPPPALGLPVPPPPPQIEQQEKPKLQFEPPGATTGATGPGGVGRVIVPRPTGSIEEAARQAARHAGSGLVVGDEDAPAPGGGIFGGPAVPIPGKLGSAVELLSDPMGVDFWPYLVKVLSTVRRNWFSVIPESARLGRQGRTVIQFAIDRNGTVPKLVIASPSGTDALDRAAVAGISASNPFPPLPADFKGGQIRLQFVFKYNVR